MLAPISDQYSYYIILLYCIPVVLSIFLSNVTLAVETYLVFPAGNGVIAPNVAAALEGVWVFGRGRRRADADDEVSIVCWHFFDLELPILPACYELDIAFI